MTAFPTCKRNFYSIDELETNLWIQVFEVVARNVCCWWSVAAKYVRGKWARLFKNLPKPLERSGERWLFVAGEHRDSSRRRARAFFFLYESRIYGLLDVVYGQVFIFLIYDVCTEICQEIHLWIENSTISIFYLEVILITKPYHGHIWHCSCRICDHFVTS